MMFIGYSQDRKGYRLIDPETYKISLDCSSSSSFQSISSIPQSDTTENVVSEPSLKKPKLEILDWTKTIFVSKENCNIIEVLKADPQGLVALNSYRVSQHLTSCNRRKLVDMLVNHCVKTYGRKYIMYLPVQGVQRFPVENYPANIET
ncbi:hypothetical protein JTE90_003423 [Oedothorax gibbosus]|uniref:Uncharacterized protein n=1 Tax=Oedothorax gibbosus TaxID=931172 RepID=A0AAV6TZQ5_9ARAC|nr:hypothetical protein JTE90_003423 [Oedothorax gibbosus]